MSTLSPEAISSVVGDIYQGAYTPASWQAAIDRIHVLLNCSRTCLVHTGAAPWTSIATLDDDEFHSEACIAAHMRDPYTTVCLNQTIGDVFRRYEIVDEVGFQRRELWNEWMRPRDMWRSLTSVLHDDDMGAWSIHLHRSGKQAEFNEEEARVLRICSEHMIRAKNIGDQFHQAISFGELFRQLPIGIALVDGNGKVEFLNNDAEALLSGSRSITIKFGRILCEHPPTQAKFAALIGSVFSQDVQATRGGALVVDGEPDTGRIVVTVAPYSGPTRFGLSLRSSAIVILRDIFPEPSTLLGEYMRDLFGLTAAEARLGVVLARGLSLQEAAARNGITTKTARTYLEQIFSKTGTRQQSQLVALIKGTAPPM